MLSRRVLKAAARSYVMPRRGIHSTPSLRQDALKETTTTTTTEGGSSPAPSTDPLVASHTESKAVYALLTQTLLRVGELEAKFSQHKDMHKAGFKQVHEQQVEQNKQIAEQRGYIKVCCISCIFFVC
jgi:hypothetical protein